VTVPSADERQQLAARLVIELGTAFQQRLVYPASHPQVRRSLERAVGALATWCATTLTDEVAIILLDEQLLVNREPLPEEAIWQRGLAQALTRHRLSGLTLASGLTVEELAAFLGSCDAPSGPLASAHLQFGRAALLDGGEAGEERSGGNVGGGEAATAERAAAEQELRAAASGAASRIEHLRGTVARLGRVAGGARLDAVGLGGIGGGGGSGGSGAAGGPEGADRSFLHGLAVALAALRLGRALGLDGDPLEAVGLAALLHDLGYLAEAAAGELPAERRRLHPLRGAARLAGIEGVPLLAVVAAYEHHLRYDQTASYPRLAAPRRPHVVARIVAVADTWVTLREHLELTRDETAAILRERAGTFLDPELVELFLATLPTA